MSRPIKFRLWDKEEKQYNMVYNQREILMTLIGEICGVVDKSYKLIDSSRYIIEECTWVYDNDGKLIHEGDIVLHTEKLEELEVIWDDWSCGFSLIHKKNGITQYYALNRDLAKKLVIKGNIHTYVRES